MPLDRLTTRADWRCRPAIASARISCAAESCCALPMQPGERWSCLDRCRWMRCSWDDPPDVNCRAKSYSAADHLINPGFGVCSWCNDFSPTMEKPFVVLPLRAGFASYVKSSNRTPVVEH